MRFSRIMAMLRKAIDDYLLWMQISGFSNRSMTHHRRICRYFVKFIIENNRPWKKIFTETTLEMFLAKHPLVKAKSVIRGLSRYLYQENRIDRPLGRHHPELPEIYKNYLAYKASIQNTTWNERLSLTGLSEYLDKKGKSLSAISALDVDRFIAESYGHLTISTQNKYRTCVRVFLRYLYHNGVLNRNISRFIKDRREFTFAKPPKFLRNHEIKQLFSSLQYNTPKDLRTNALIYLAFTLGIRPKEISLIRLDDISFENGKITLSDRKNRNPIVLPLPESSERNLFLNLTDQKPLTNLQIAKDITACMRKAGLPSSAYWLRHTYAQNLLENEVSIFEIKEMMGHDNIQTTRKYIQIDIRMMRKVLFDETL